MQLEFFPSWNDSLLAVQGERFKGCSKICFPLKLIQTGLGEAPIPDFQPGEEGKDSLRSQE